MVSKNENKVTETPKEKLEEDRIDDFSIDQFKHLGFTGRLPDNLVGCFLEFKKRKDKLSPGRLSPEGFAMVTMITNLIDRKDV